MHLAWPFRRGQQILWTDTAGARLRNGVIGPKVGSTSGPMFGKVPMTALDRAVRSVRREEFLPPEQLPHVSEDIPLPIGHGQTISQPSLVVEMTRELAIDERSRVLEIGTGSGYQTALLAELAKDVFTIERIPELAAAAESRLRKLGYHTIRFRVGDGAEGWPEEAPYDGIIVTAAPPVLPAKLVDQLALGGRMVIPVGPTVHDQTLMLVVKDSSGAVWERELFGVRFVPLISDDDADRDEDE